MSFRETILKKIENEKKIITENKRDPTRYTEFGNDLCMRRIHDHELKLSAYKDILKEYDIEAGLRASVTMYSPIEGVRDIDRMNELSGVAVKGDMYKNWRFDGGRWV